jgi:hypothetical protein
MFKTRLTIVVAFAAGLILSLAGNRASAELSIVSQSVAVDRSDQDVMFTLVFNQAPNFTAIDSFGRPQDSFQYEIVPNTLESFDTLPYMSVAAVIRGDEIDAGSVLPIRYGFGHGEDRNPAAGGWGPIITAVPFTLTGTTMTWDTPFSVLGTTNGHFAYNLFTTNFGTTVSSVESVSIPLPAALPIGLITLGLVGALMLFLKRAI